jgi:hypothetical protein
MISITPDVSVGYEIRPGDLAAVLIENQRHRRFPRFTRSVVIFAAMAGMLTFFCVYLIGGRTATATAILGGAFVAGAVVVQSPRAAREMAVKRVARRLTDPGNAFLLGPRIVELGAEGFAIRGPDSDLRYRWAALKRAAQMPERILLYLTDFSAHPMALDPAASQSVMATIRKYAPHAAATTAESIAL